MVSDSSNGILLINKDVYPRQYIQIKAHTLVLALLPQAQGQDYEETKFLIIKEAGPYTELDEAQPP